MSQQTILVVDDELEIRQALMIRLKNAGYDVITAANGIQAIQSAINKLPDLIICDISMPSGDGHEVVNVINQSTNASDIPVIFLTALHDADNMNRAVNSGVTHYFTKPYKPDELLATIKGILSGVSV